jgi:sterol desaturase/sphingolipid hydroxylase (fatty acid hydroxylase superfamily)
MAEQLSFVPTLPNPVDWAIPAFIALIVAEMIWAQRQKPAGYEPRDTLTSLLFGLGSTVTGLLAAGTIGTIAFAAYDLRLASIPFVWWAWIACFVLDDLLYYAAASIIIFQPHYGKHGQAFSRSVSSFACRCC